MVGEIKSPARLKVFEFVRTSYGEDFVFEFDGGKGVADLFVRNMRVELSRLRKMAEDAGRTVVPFRMKLVEMEEIQGQNGSSGIKTKVTLRRVKSAGAEAVEEFSEVINQISVAQSDVKEG